MRIKINSRHFLVLIQYVMGTKPLLSRLPEGGCHINPECALSGRIVCCLNRGSTFVKLAFIFNIFLCGQGYTSYASTKAFSTATYYEGAT